MRLLLPLSLAATLAAAAAGATAGAQTVYDTGLPNSWEANAFSDHEQADYFELVAPATVGAVRLWTMEYNTPVQFPGTMTWALYLDDGNGLPVATPFASGTSPAAHVASPGTFFGFGWSFQVDFLLAAPVSLAASTRYWLSLHEGTPSQTTFPQVEFWQDIKGPGSLWAAERQMGDPSAQWAHTQLVRHPFVLLESDALAPALPPTTTTPEPASLALVGGGLLALATAGWRRRARA